MIKGNEGGGGAENVEGYEYSRRRSESATYDPCDVLGMKRADFFALDPAAQEAEAKKRFRAKAKELHPDLTQDPDEKKRRHEAFKEVNQAYAFLTNDEIKAQEQQFHAAQEDLEAKRAAQAQAKEDQARQKQEAQAQAQAESPQATPNPEPAPTPRSEQRPPRPASNEDLTKYHDAKPQFRTTVDVRYWQTFVDFQQQREFKLYNLKPKETDSTQSFSSLINELKTLTHDLAQQHETPRKMFNYYMKALSELAKMIVTEYGTLSVDDFKTSPEYRVVEAYQQLMAGSLSVQEVFGEHAPELFKQVANPDGTTSFVLKEDLSDADLLLLDDKLRTKIANKILLKEQAV